MQLFNIINNYNIILYTIFKFKDELNGMKGPQHDSE